MDFSMLGDQRLLECVVTTRNEDGSTNIAPMGPIVDQGMTRALLRPFQTSQTYANLVREPRGVLNITDDVELIARAALHKLDEPPALQQATDAGETYLSEACRWYAFEVESIDDSRPRTEIVCQLGEAHRLRDFVGFNRAMHAVIEATILATRLHLIDKREVIADVDRLAPLVEKTGSEKEHRAFLLVREYIENH